MNMYKCTCMCINIETCWSILVWANLAMFGDGGREEAVRVWERWSGRGTPLCYN